MFVLDRVSTFWVADNDFMMPAHMEAFVDSSYASELAHVIGEGNLHHSSGFVFNVYNGQKNYGFTRNDLPSERLRTSNNGELVGINLFLSYIEKQQDKPLSITIICDNLSLMKLLTELHQFVQSDEIVPDDFVHSLHNDDVKTFLQLAVIFPVMSFKHVFGHRDTIENILADKLATFAKKRKAGSDARPKEIIEMTAMLLKNHQYKSIKPSLEEYDYIVALSEESRPSKNGKAYYGYALYNAETDHHIQGVFKIDKDNKHYLYAVAALNGLGKLTGQIPQGSKLCFKFANFNSEILFIKYANGYLVDANIVSGLVKSYSSTVIDTINDYEIIRTKAMSTRLGTPSGEDYALAVTLANAALMKF